MAMIAVPSADAEAARLRAALSAQIDVVRALESSVGELSAAWDARKTAYEARIHQLEAELHISRKATARVPVYAPVPIAAPAPPDAPQPPGPRSRKRAAPEVMPPMPAARARARRFDAGASKENQEIVFAAPVKAPDELAAPVQSPAVLTIADVLSGDIFA